MRRLERTGLAATVAALAVGGVIAACSNTVTGTAQVNQEELVLYTSEVRASSAAASSSRAAVIERAARSACRAFRDTNKRSIDAFNAYIDAGNSRAPDIPAKAAAATTALRAASSRIGSELTASVPSAVTVALRAYISDSTTLANMVERNAPSAEMNTHIDKFNATKNRAVHACDDY
ncbi:hypothetical protein [Nocardia paucivorans]|uniref:hypothetical protein n=1 Tax=Nocardia paucivorans TaxID=114259 RepID=UPI0003106542|nr:hypothetical protein [Nocardia paucivorans]